MTTQPTPTPAEYAAADAIARWFGNEPDFVRERIAQIIAAHRAPETDMIDALALTFHENSENARSEAERLAEGLAATHANGRAYAYGIARDRLRAALAERKAAAK